MVLNETWTQRSLLRRTNSVSGVELASAVLTPWLSISRSKAARNATASFPCNAISMTSRRDIPMDILPGSMVNRSRNRLFQFRRVPLSSNAVRPSLILSNVDFIRAAAAAFSRSSRRRSVTSRYRDTSIPSGDFKRLISINRPSGSVSSVVSVEARASMARRSAMKASGSDTSPNSPRSRRRRMICSAGTGVLNWSFGSPYKV